MSCTTTVSGPPASTAASSAALEVLVDQRVRDDVELPEGGLVGEHDSGQLGPVERPVGPKYPWSEGLRDPRETRSPGSTTALAALSPSRTTAPSAASRSATALFPDPIPPVSPTRSTLAPFAFNAFLATIRRGPPAVPDVPCPGAQGTVAEGQ